jgi:hypothetical protein
VGCVIRCGFAAYRTYPGKAKDPLETPATRRLLYDNYYYYYDTYVYAPDLIEGVDFGGTLFGQLTVYSDEEYMLGASVLLGDWDLNGAIELGAQVNFDTLKITPSDSWGPSLVDTLDKLPGLIDGLPGDHTLYGWWRAFTTVSATLVQVSGSALVSLITCLLSVPVCMGE